MNIDRKTLVTSIISSVVTTIVILVLLFAIVSNHRSGVALYFNQTPQAKSGPIESPESQSAVVSAVQKANPAVVSIIITKNEPVYVPDNSTMPDPFGFFNIIPRYRQNGTQPQEIGGGSGFLVSPDGLVVTNQHVVSVDGAQYSVYTNDGIKHSAKVLTKDPLNDIAFLKIDGSNYHYLNFDESNNLKLGQTVIAIGNALSEFQNTVSVGVVSGLSRSITAGSSVTGEAEQLDEVIQTDAAINPGNSGGPLLDLSGNVIGVNVAIAVGSQNIGFALPSDVVKAAVDSVRTKGYVSWPYLGVRYTEINDAYKLNHNVPVDYGDIVSKGSADEPAVIPGSPAAKAGIAEGDIILEADGTKLDATHKLSTIVRAKKVGDPLVLTILHGGKQKQVTITLQEYPQSK